VKFATFFLEKRSDLVNALVILFNILQRTIRISETLNCETFNPEEENKRGLTGRTANLFPSLDSREVRIVGLEETSREDENAKAETNRYTDDETSVCTSKQQNEPWKRAGNGRDLSRILMSIGFSPEEQQGEKLGRSQTRRPAGRCDRRVAGASAALKGRTNKSMRELFIFVFLSTPDFTTCMTSTRCRGKIKRELVRPINRRTASSTFLARCKRYRIINSWLFGAR